MNETLTDPEARKEDESEGKESSPHDKDEEQSAESVESKEKTELEKKLFDVISTFVPHQTDSGMKNMLVGKAIEQLGDLNSDQKMEMVNVLEEYLKQRVHEAEKLINVDAETAVRLAKEISANKKEFVLRKLEAEIKASKQKIEDLEEDISTQEKQLKDYGVSQKGGGSPDVLKRRKEIEGKIESLRTERQTGTR